MTTRRRSQKSIVKRQRIVEMAATVLAERGYAHTRLSDIAARLEIHAGSLYYYFPSKEALVEEVVQKSNVDIAEYVNAHLDALPSSATFREKIETIVSSHLRRILQRDPYTRAARALRDQIPPKLQWIYTEGAAAYKHLLSDLFDQAAAHGEIRDDVSLSIVRLALIGSMTWSLSWYRPGKLSPDEIAQVISAVFIEGLLVRGPAGGGTPNFPEFSRLLEMLADEPASVRAAVARVAEGAVHAGREMAGGTR